MSFECPACNVTYENASFLNKHISICEYYDNWYKTYTPPKYMECDKCKRQFIDISQHQC